MPLVLQFHGAGGNGEGFAGTFQLDSGEMVLISPDGVVQDWAGGGVGWDTRNNTTPDIQLVQALIQRATAEHCIDTSRIYAIGFSWGGWMATQVACALGASLRGFVSVAGGGPGGSCAGPVGGMVVHGTNDGAEPIAAGTQSRDKFQGIDGCGDSLGTASVPGCQAFGDCTKPLLWCQHEGGHEIPGFVTENLESFLLSLP